MKGQVRAGEVLTGQTGQDSSGHARMGQVLSGREQEGSDPVRTGLDGAGWGRLGQSRLGQVKKTPNHLKLSQISNFV